MLCSVWAQCRPASSFVLAATLWGCGSVPAPPAAAPSAPDTASYLQSAQLALAHYVDADASLALSQRLASQRFHTSQVSAAELIPTLPDGPGQAPELGTDAPPAPAGQGLASPVPEPLDRPQADPADQNDLDLPGLAAGTPLRPESIDELVGVAPAKIEGFESTRSRFNRAAADFNPRLLGADGLELDASGGILVNPFRLRAQLRADLHANPDLSNPSLDLEGRLSPPQPEREPQILPGLGYRASASKVLTQAGAESLLLSYQHQASIRDHRVRVISRAQALNLRLAGAGRLGLRQVSGGGEASLSTELNLRAASGQEIELFEQRFVNASGAGAGFGSFVIRTAARQNISGSLRSLNASDGRLMLIFEPDSPGLGRLLLQQLGPGQARLCQFDAEGQVIASTELGLDQLLAAPLIALSEPGAKASVR